ncbi:hypothetical protein ES702_07303 [subsurface metagenome]
MKKLLCLFIVFSLFACSDYKTPFTDKKSRPPGELGRFQMVAGGPQLGPFVIDTKEGYVWRLKLGGDAHLKLLNFDKKYQSALEAVRAYSSRPTTKKENDPLGIR